MTGLRRETRKSGNLHWLFLIALAASIFSPMEKASAEWTVSFLRSIQLPRGPYNSLLPVSVTYDPVAGELCVTDSRHPAMHVVNKAGIAVFQTNSTSSLQNPLDGCLDARGNFVFLDKAGAGQPITIRKLDLFGEPIFYQAETPSSSWSPRHLIISGDGHYLTLDPDHALLAKHHKDSGDLLWQKTILDNQEEDVQRYHRQSGNT